jgi:hypothetical protein
MRLNAHPTIKTTFKEAYSLADGQSFAVRGRFYAQEIIDFLLIDDNDHCSCPDRHNRASGGPADDHARWSSDHHTIGRHIGTAFAYSAAYANTDRANQLNRRLNYCSRSLHHWAEHPGRQLWRYH